MFVNVVRKILFIVQMLSLLPFIAGALLLYSSINHMKQPSKGVKDMMKFEEYVYTRGGIRTSNLYTILKGYRLSDFSEINHDITRVKEFLLKGEKLDTYLIQNDSLLPIWTFEGTSYTLFRLPEDGENLGYRYVHYYAKQAAKLMSPFFVIGFLNYLLVKFVLVKIEGGVSST